MHSVSFALKSFQLLDSTDVTSTWFYAVVLQACNAHDFTTWREILAHRLTVTAQQILCCLIQVLRTSRQLLQLQICLWPSVLRNVCTELSMDRAARCP